MAASVRDHAGKVRDTPWETARPACSPRPHRRCPRDHAQAQTPRGGNCTQLTTDVGLDDEVDPNGTATFTVLGDGKTLATTPVLDNNQAAYPLSVDVTGVQQLDLVVGDGGDGNGHDHGDWAGAKLQCHP